MDGDSRSRRSLLRAGGIVAAAGLTGCLRLTGGGGTPTAEPTPTATASATPTDSTTETVTSTQSEQVVFTETFSDGGYTDNWEFDPNAHYTETVRQENGYLLHKTKDTGDLLWTKSAFPSEGVRRL